MSVELRNAVESWDNFTWDKVKPDVIYKFESGPILRQDRFTEDPVYVQNGKIIEQPELNTDIVTVNLGHAILAPGYIDIQINGGFGIDFTTSLTTDSIGLKEVSSKLLSYGVTSFCPTIVSTLAEQYIKIMKHLSVFEGSRDGAACLGAHLEGPFISLTHKGAHDPQCITDYPDGIDDVNRVYGIDNWSNVAIVTLAPEKQRSSEVITYLTSHNVVVSLGHTDATYEKACNAVAHGASMVTHLFNSMAAFHHRKPGTVGLLGRREPDLYFGIVADNQHLHDATLRLAYHSKPKGIVLVSDGTSAMGLGDGQHILGSQVVCVRGTKTTINGTDTLSGSVTPINLCVKHFHEVTGCTAAEALSYATFNPAKALGIDRKKGNITIGATADFVVLNDNFDVISTWIQGRAVYINKSFV